MKSIHIKSIPRILTIANLLLVLLLMVSFLVLVRDVIATRYTKVEKAPSRRSSGALTPSSAKRPLQDYEIILRSSLFGLPSSPLVALSGSQEKGVSQGDLTLIGTIAGQESRSFAIFSDNAGKQEIYRVGETIPGVGRLDTVQRDKVTIRGTGRPLEIPIADIVRITEVAPSSGTARSSDFARSVGAGAYIVDQKKVQQAIESPNQLMTDARLQPNFANGKQEGFTLREVRAGGIYQSLGMQNGDVLLRINDYNISNPENALQAFTALRGMDRIQLDILRNGSKMTLTYQIR
jgi:type II secretion system protein C